MKKLTEILAISAFYNMLILATFGGLLLTVYHHSTIPAVIFFAALCFCFFSYRRHKLAHMAFIEEECSLREQENKYTWWIWLLF
jgi:4-amino-4-deoxy-L-arabinose transferase-like glycosyltransferase